MTKTSPFFITALFTLVVITLGAYTRLADAGLGCPDWPGCFGQLFVPQGEKHIALAEASFPDAGPFDASKAWPEMIHRYLAGTLGMAVIALSVYIMRSSPAPWYRSYLALSLLAIIALQATLGLWTVSFLLHPTIVSLHLLGGFGTFLLLFWQSLGQKKQKTTLDKWAFFVLAIIIMQVCIGAWTSTNYASLICPDFPYCQGKLFPPTAFKESFNLFMPINGNYEFGILSHTARVTIHMTHRYFALLTSICILTFLSIAYANGYIKIRHLVTTSCLLLAQITLGILNILLLLPTYIAVGHNICGLLLTASWLWTIHSLSHNEKPLMTSPSSVSSK